MTCTFNVCHFDLLKGWDLFWVDNLIELDNNILCIMDIYYWKNIHPGNKDWWFAIKKTYKFWLCQTLQVDFESDISNKLSKNAWEIKRIWLNIIVYNYFINGYMKS